LHYDAIKEALNCISTPDRQPFVSSYKESVELEELAREKGLLIASIPPKRFDDRSLIARQRYRNGEFGELKAGRRT